MTPAQAPRTFTVRDVQEAGHTLEPISCLNPDCDEPEPDVVYSQLTSDGICQHCGESQEQFL